MSRGRSGAGTAFDRPAPEWYIAQTAVRVMENGKRGSAIRFGIFEVDLQAGELRRQGLKIKLQEQPFQILSILLERPGEVITREELQKQLWPADTFVDFERGLNRAMNRLREALGDDADRPRFIETFPRRGYRFVAPVEVPVARESGGHDGTAPVPLPPAPAAALPRPRFPAWAASGALAAVAAIAGWGLWHAPRTTGQPYLQLDLDVGPDAFSQPAISPDGMRIVFTSKGSLAIRRLDQQKITRLAGTDGASLPFFSPDGRWVAFFAAGKLHRVAVEGGSQVALCDAPSAGGGTWSEDDTIIATLNSSDGLSRIPAAGGQPRLLTDAKSDPAGVLMHLSPQALPGGKSVLFAAVNGSARGSLRILTLADGKVRTVVENVTHGRYLADGHLVYYRQGSLFAAPLALDRLELTGPAVPLADGVSAAGGFGRAEFDLSGTGTLVYRSGAAGTVFLLSWVYPSGKTEPVLARPGNYFTPRLSPDGKRLALAAVREGKQNLWVYDLSRETWTRLTFDDTPVLRPAWSADGEFLAFRWGNTIAWKRSDGSGTTEALAGLSPNAAPASFSPDGKWLAFWPLQAGSDLWIAPLGRGARLLTLGPPRALLQQPGSKGSPAISPDGRWLAYNSNESGRFEIYVVPFSPQGEPAGSKLPISSGGGSNPVWSRNGRELLYQTLDHRIHVAGYRITGDAFVADKPRPWSEVRLGDTGIFPAFDLAPDGKRALALLPAGESWDETLVRVLLHVDHELRRQAQVRR